MKSQSCSRREFLGEAVVAGAAASLSGGVKAVAQSTDSLRKHRRIRVGIIGCGSVSGSYLPHLSNSPHAEVVSTCDIIPERAMARAKQFNVSNHYAHIDQMLRGIPFDLFVNLTDMQEHEHLNRQALEAGKHVWSEKPIANSYANGLELLDLAKKKGVRLWGAPVVVASPQFAFMAKTIAAGKLGRLASAHADYGHTGPTWSAFFYQAGGGSMPDLGVYNLTSLTGLLGPAKSVVAMTSIVTPTRLVDTKGEIKVTEEDNAMVLIDHGNGVISNVQCGFNFFNPHGHEGSQESRHTISIYGSHGSMGLVGYDWEPLGVDLATQANPTMKRYETDARGYVWQQGASMICASLATGTEPPMTPEHALHVVDIIGAARESQNTGQRVKLASTFNWPIV